MNWTEGVCFRGSSGWSKGMTRVLWNLDGTGLTIFWLGCCAFPILRVTIELSFKLLFWCKTTVLGLFFVVVFQSKILLVVSTGQMLEDLNQASFLKGCFKQILNQPFLGFFGLSHVSYMHNMSVWWYLGSMFFVVLSNLWWLLFVLYCSLLRHPMIVACKNQNNYGCL